MTYAWRPLPIVGDLLVMVWPHEENLPTGWTLVESERGRFAYKYASVNESPTTPYRAWAYGPKVKAPGATE